MYEVQFWTASLLSIKIIQKLFRNCCLQRCLIKKWTYISITLARAENIKPNNIEIQLLASLYKKRFSGGKNPNHKEETLKSKQIRNTYQFLPMKQELPAVSFYVSPSKCTLATASETWDTEILPFPEAWLSNTFVFHTEINDQGERISPTVSQSREMQLCHDNSADPQALVEERSLLSVPKPLQGPVEGQHLLGIPWMDLHEENITHFLLHCKQMQSPQLSLSVVKHTLRIHSRKLYQLKPAVIPV